MLKNPSHLVYIVLSPILSTAFALINIITIYIFYRKFRLTTLSLIVIVNICICDIFVCLVSNTFYVVNLLHPVYAWWTGAVACKLFKFFTMLTNIAQIYFLCILNADRLRRLMYNTPKQWQKRHGICFISIGWISATIVCLPRLGLFDVKIVKNYSSIHNSSIVISRSCHLADFNEDIHLGITVFTFVIAYVIPACFILYTLGRSQVYMWKRRKQIHFSTMSNAVTKMNSKLALTFNCTGILFILIWTPFFILSLIELGDNHWIKDKHMKFSLRCTLLILGSAKPIVYVISLDKFRYSFPLKANWKFVTNTGVANSDEKSNYSKRTGSSQTLNLQTVLSDSVV